MSRARYKVSKLVKRHDFCLKMSRQHSSPMPMSCSRTILAVKLGLSYATRETKMEAIAKEVELHKLEKTKTQVRVTRFLDQRKRIPQVISSITLLSHVPFNDDKPLALSLGKCMFLYD